MTTTKLRRRIVTAVLAALVATGGFLTTACNNPAPSSNVQCVQSVDNDCDDDHDGHKKHKTKTKSTKTKGSKGKKK